MSDASTQPVTLSIHGTPHALPTVLNTVSHAHVADLHYLLTSETGIPVGTASRRARPLGPHQLHLLPVSDTSTQPGTLSIHGTPHALPTVANAVSHAHVADLHYLLTSEAGIPVRTPSRRLRSLGLRQLHL